MKRIEFGQQHFGVAAHDHEQIVEVVRDAAREAPYGFHFLCLAKLIFESAPVGYVFSNRFEHVGGLVGAAHRAAADADGNRAAIFALPAHFDSIEAAAAAEVFDQACVLLG